MDVVVTVAKEDGLVEIGAIESLKEETEGVGDVHFATLIILLKAYDVCSWISSGIALGFEKPYLEETTLCGAKRVTSGLAKTLGAS